MAMSPDLFVTTVSTKLSLSFLSIVESMKEMSAALISCPSFEESDFWAESRWMSSPILRRSNQSENEPVSFFE